MIPHWIIGGFIWLLGLAVGSFLNVVVYRLPRGLSLNKPARSFCPNCKNPIAAYDNLPVLSWLLLRGRCRRCTQPISVVYPLVEAATGLAFLMVYCMLDAMPCRDGVADLRWPQDTPLLLAWLTLIAALLASATLDIESYYVDTRISDFAMYAGIVLYFFWPGPARSTPSGPTATPFGAAAFVGAIASGVMLWLTVWRQSDESASTATPDGETSEKPSQAAPTTQRGVSASLSVAAVLAFAGLAVWLLVAATQADAGGVHDGVPIAQPFGLPISLGFAVLFLSVVIASGQHRSADAELQEAIEDERAGAHRLAFSEILWLTPIVVAGLGAYFLVSSSSAVAGVWQTITAWTPVEGIFPIAGATVAMAGLMIAAAAGWLLRLVFTLALGREAFGTGDIFILAAAGACAGWDIALAGLGFAVGLALVGFIVGMLFKQMPMISFVPWLTLGFLMALWLNVPLNAAVREHFESVMFVAREQPYFLTSMAAILLGGGVISVVIARLLRRSFEPVTPDKSAPRQ